MTDRKPGIGITVHPISASETYPLRQAVLRPGRPPSEAVFSGDELSITSHWGAFSAEGELLAIASLYRAPMPGTTAPAWQLRGMASDLAVRGQGYGAAVLSACIEHLRAEAPGETLWCNARSSAVGFYERFGFRMEGAKFDIPTVGPHYVMSRKV